MQTRAASTVLAACAIALAACSQTPETEKKEGSGHSVLAPLPDAAGYVPRIGKLVYVPVYSNIYWGFDGQSTELAATLSIRNVNLKHPIVVHSVKYYDSAGTLVREYVHAPSTLAPMSTADFVIQRRDTTGGPGANFLVQWSSPFDIDEPLIESVMIGQHGNAGISFSGMGRVLPKASEELFPIPGRGPSQPNRER
ncbi:MAG: DUF3124 domain-containing protein [Bryobacteraceae bacterium]